MSGRMRPVSIASVAVLAVGLAAGLIFYAVRPMRAAGGGGPDELRLVPRSASLVAYAGVHDLMVSDARQRVHQVRSERQRLFQDETGINLDTDIDHIVLGLVPVPAAEGGEPAALLLARGRFDEGRIQTLMTAHGAQGEVYKGIRLLVPQPDAQGGKPLSLAFLEPGLIGLGGAPVLRAAIDVQGGAASVTGNADVMDRVRAADDGTVWAVGKFDQAAQGRVPAGLGSQLPPIDWISFSAHVTNGIKGLIQADVKDEAAANNLREAIRGLTVLAKLQSVTRPDLREAVESLMLGGTGNSVTLSFDAPPAVFDALSSLSPTTPSAK